MTPTIQFSLIKQGTVVSNKICFRQGGVHLFSGAE